VKFAAHFGLEGVIDQLVLLYADLPRNVSESTVAE